MRTMFRILLILVVASLIGGLMVAGVNASGSSAEFGDFDGDRPRSPEGAEFRPEFEGRDERGEGGFGFPGGMIKAIVLMSIAGGVYSAILWLGKNARRVTSG